MVMFNFTRAIKKNVFSEKRLESLLLGPGCLLQVLLLLSCLTKLFFRETQLCSNPREETGQKMFTTSYNKNTRTCCKGFWH